MKKDQENELYQRANVVIAKCREFLKYNENSDEKAFSLGIEFLASGQLFTEAAGHTCLPATNNQNALLFGLVMSKDESAIIGLILKQMHSAFPVNNNTPKPENKILLDSALCNAISIIDEIRKDDADLYDVNAVLIKSIARLLYAAINLDLTQSLKIKDYDANKVPTIELQEPIDINLLPFGYGGC